MAKIGKEDIDAVVASSFEMRANSVERVDPGMNPEAMAEAMDHPRAMEVVAEIIEREPGSCQAGQAAPDFELDRLGGGEKIRLSRSFGGRPVGLVFGSFT